MTNDMLGRRIGRVILLFIPLWAYLLAGEIPDYSGRISMAVQGYPFASVVPRRFVDFSKYSQLSENSWIGDEIVFSGGKPVGWIDEPMGQFPEFMPLSTFSGRESGVIYVSGIISVDVVIGMLLILAWNLSNYFLVAQAALLLLWVYDCFGRDVPTESARPVSIVEKRHNATTINIALVIAWAIFASYVLLVINPDDPFGVFGPVETYALSVLLCAAPIAMIALSGARKGRTFGYWYRLNSFQQFQ
jgi:hypothetical protein